jgi:hypothetical protein
VTVKDIIQQVDQLSLEEWRELFLYMQQQGLKYHEIYSQAEEDSDEMTKAEILQSLRQSMKEALAGHLTPAREAIDALEHELTDNANES